ncbi:MAG: AAA family ATPase, partial [candidate division NC10 bacterium]|nr:AAA family ATPase [candidate division NC10 bacterium]
MRCGTEVPEQDGEIKQVTVLSCDPGFEDPGALDPETLHFLVSRFLQLARVEVDRYGGALTQALPHGVVALFGAPVGHEDHPQRGALAAIGLLERLRESAPEIQAEHGLAWRARIGLDSGPVVLGIGATAVGAAAEAARRLMELAEPGTILASDRIAGLVGSRLELEPRELPAGTGAPSRPREWRVIGVASPPVWTPVVPDRDLSPFVGRAREMAVLEELGLAVRAGQGQVVGIAGEAGAGKSRLLLEFSRTLRGQAVTCLRGHCLSYASGIPCFPFVDMIRKA